MKDNNGGRMRGADPDHPEDLDLISVLGPLSKLDKDIDSVFKKQVEEFTLADVRFFVDLYYQLQDFRKAAFNQEGASKGKEPTNLVEWVGFQMEFLEQRVVQKALRRWTDRDEVSVWAKGIYGVGPVLSAGLRAHIDITRAPTAGKIWRFAGLDPNVEWLGSDKAKQLVKEAREVVGKRASLDDLAVYIAAQTNRKPESLIALTKKFALKADGTMPAKGPTAQHLTKAVAFRPWNARLKVLCWKIGESFCKFHNREKCSYGHLYKIYKDRQQEKNIKGDFREEAERTLQNRNIKHSETKACYEAGQLPPGRIDLRARRYATKIFLSHWHHVAYKAHYKQDPPLPYVIAHLGHGNLIRPEDMT